MFCLIALPIRLKYIKVLYVWKCIPENNMIEWCMLRESDIKLKNELKKLNDKFDEQMKALILALNNWNPKGD